MDVSIIASDYFICGGGGMVFLQLIKGFSSLSLQNGTLKTFWSAASVILNTYYNLNDGSEVFSF